MECSSFEQISPDVTNAPRFFAQSSSLSQIIIPHGCQFLFHFLQILFDYGLVILITRQVSELTRIFGDIK